MMVQGGRPPLEVMVYAPPPQSELHPLLGEQARVLRLERENKNLSTSCPYIRDPYLCDRGILARASPLPQHASRRTARARTP